MRARTPDEIAAFKTRTVAGARQRRHPHMGAFDVIRFQSMAEYADALAALAPDGWTPGAQHFGMHTLAKRHKAG